MKLLAKDDIFVLGRVEVENEKHKIHNTHTSKLSERFSEDSERGKTDPDNRKE